MKLGIIIVTYNSKNEIARLLESIAIQNITDSIIYLVDNNSNDDTLDIVSKFETDLSICIIASSVNNGFAGGNNIGIQRAMEEGCDYVFILNPDMQLNGKCIEIMTKRLESEPTLGVIGPIVLFGNNIDNIIQVYGVKANFKTQKKVDNFSNEKLTNEIPSDNYVDMVLGGAMMIRSDVLKVTGFFEEDYFMYNDEIDLAYRVKKAGYKSLCLRDAVVRHFHDFAPKNKRGNNFMYYYIMRNRYLYFKKYNFYMQLSFSLVIELFNIPFKVIWSLRRMKNIKILNYYYSGLIDGLMNRKGMANKSFD
jgi:GT2 family glycosyltransferase